MELNSDLDSLGLFDARYQAFLETLSQLRPHLHRYCARMTGSMIDGEDVMQEALFEAYRKLDQFDDTRALSPWLFRIAHNRCIDFLRKRQVREQVETDVAISTPDLVEPTEPFGPGLGKAIERLVANLPPKERACVLLKDVFDNSLEEIAALVGSTTGGVKAALNRARTKLAKIKDNPSARQAMSPDAVKLVRTYVDRFNRKDWDGVRELTSADARLRVADCFSGRLSESPYFAEYERSALPWRLDVAELDGEPALIVSKDAGQGLVPSGVVYVEIANGKIIRILDFYKCPWILASASSITVARREGQAPFSNNVS